MKYRKKPVVIEAIQYRGENAKEIIDFTNGQALRNTGWAFLTIPTLEGDHRCDIADWVIKGVNGEFYPCKPDIFEKTYEPIEEKE